GTAPPPPTACGSHETGDQACRTRPRGVTCSRVHSTWRARLSSLGCLGFFHPLQHPLRGIDVLVLRARAPATPLQFLCFLLLEQTLLEEVAPVHQTGHDVVRL